MKSKMKRMIPMVWTADFLPPEGVPVLVAGGVAMLTPGGHWYSGMEEPLYKRPLEWVPKWWAAIPTEND